MATAKDYQVGAATAQALIEADIAKDVPSFFRGEIPADMPATLGAAVAKAVIDAVDAERAKINQAT